MNLNVYDVITTFIIYLTQIFRAKDSFTYLDIGDENMSNWMMFIRQAESYSEQNLVAYQHNGSIYYSLIKVGYIQSKSL